MPSVVMDLKDLACQEMLVSLRELFTSGARHDLTIVAGRNYHVHSSIVCGRSKPLMLACNHDSAKAPPEYPGLPKVTLHLSEDDPYAVDCMMQYFYHFCYIPPPSRFGGSDDGGASITDNMEPSKNTLVVHARVYAIAKKYEVQGLRILAAANFSGAAGELWNTDDFLATAYEVFESADQTDYALRGVVVRVFRSHKDQLMRKKQAENLLMDLPALAVELLKDTHQPSNEPIQQQSTHDQLAAPSQSGPGQPRLSRRKRATLLRAFLANGGQRSDAPVSGALREFSSSNTKGE